MSTKIEKLKLKLAENQRKKKIVPKTFEKWCNSCVECPELVDEVEGKYLEKLYEHLPHRPQINSPMNQVAMMEDVKENNFRLKLRACAKRELIHKKLENDTISDEEMDQIDQIIESHFPSATDDLLTYDQYRELIELLMKKKNKKFLKFLTIPLFSALNFNHQISISQIKSFIMKQSWTSQTRYGLALYDFDGGGMLSQNHLTQYIMELIPTLTSLNHLSTTLYNFYSMVVVRKFFFFLDPMKLRRIRISDILVSGYLDDLLELRDEIDQPLNSSSFLMNDLCGNYLTKKNWFSAENCERIFQKFIQLDRDGNGKLSREEMNHFANFTSTFLDVLFDTISTELEYVSFIDLLLARETINEPQSIRYFFRFLDFSQKGYMTAFDIEYFYEGVKKEYGRLNNLNEEDDEETNGEKEQKKLDEINNFFPSTLIMCREIFDMISPKNLERIYLKDLINCGFAATVVTILIDVRGFYLHEHRDQFETRQMMEQQPPEPVEDVDVKSPSSDSLNLPTEESYDNKLEAEHQSGERDDSYNVYEFDEIQSNF
ncbi:hypothetical protein SNEBB_007882 [Seison nebaliae]|nr:hypothetical protein SNEBB_007882 [Seison nebaliae]